RIRWSTLALSHGPHAPSGHGWFVQSPVAPAPIWRWLHTPDGWEVLGFRFESGNEFSRPFWFGCEVPLWFLAIFLSLMPSLAVIRARRRWARLRRGACLRCGYDLRATPRGGGELLPRCPE